MQFNKLYVSFQWPEITEALLPGQRASDRPDLCARVFKLKLDKLTKDIYQEQILGRVIGHVHVIEFQKRGLPHAHMLIILAEEDKPRTADDLDELISAELPDPVTEPELYAIVSRCMMHGPCGPGFPNAPCMKDGVCSKGYPRQFADETTATEDGYPRYRRRNDGRTATVHRANGVTAVLDNRSVVPHNRPVVKIGCCHINLEGCFSIRVIKYVYKYIFKGHDRIMYDTRVADPTAAADAPVDEIQRYQDARYVSASESCWRIYGFSLHSEWPNVVRLQVHLENHEMTYFADNDNVQEIVDAGPRRTTLTAWFAANEACAEGRHLLYNQFPKHYVWKSNRTWSARVSGESGTVGRMYMVSPAEGERFYLRLLLHHVPGAQSYEHLRTVDGQLLESFREAAVALGVAEGDHEWRDGLAEAAVMQTGRQLRRLFATMLQFGNPVAPEALFQEFEEALCDDIMRGHEHRDLLHAEIVNEALLDIEAVLNDAGKCSV